MARACAAQTKSTFLKLAGPQLVQMFIGDGAKLVRDAFALAKEKAPAIIFIDELDAIGKNKKKEIPVISYYHDEFINLNLFAIRHEAFRLRKGW